MSASTETSRGRERFQTTHWTMVLTARNDSDARGREAMERLCRAYWYPLYAFARRSGHSPEDAADLTQVFFEKLIEKDFLKLVDPAKGRFRNFLLVSLKRFMAREWRKQQALKRGGDAVFVEIDACAAESRYALEPVDDASPEMLYDRRWAMTLLERTLANLRNEYAETGRERIFEALKEFLTGTPETGSYAEAAERAGIAEGAVRVAVHRLRRRFRDIFRDEIARTVQPEDVEEENRQIRAILSGRH